MMSHWIFAFSLFATLSCCLGQYPMYTDAIVNTTHIVVIDTVSYFFDFNNFVWATVGNTSCNASLVCNAEYLGSEVTLAVSFPFSATLPTSPILNTFAACGIILRNNNSIDAIVRKSCVSSISVSDNLTLAAHQPFLSRSAVGMDANKLTPPVSGMTRLNIAYKNTTGNWQVPPNPSSDIVRVALFDSGIAEHPDLQSVSSAINCVSKTFEDDTTDFNGHGTFMAGIISAANQGSGIVGVAPNVSIYAVKVVEDSGRGNVATLLCGLNWLANQPNINSTNSWVPTLPFTAGGPVVSYVLNATTNRAMSGNVNNLVDDHSGGYLNHDPLHTAISNVIAIVGVSQMAATFNSVLLCPNCPFPSACIPPPIPFPPCDPNTGSIPPFPQLSATFVAAAGNGNASTLTCGANTSVLAQSFQYIKPAAYRAEVLTVTSFSDTDGFGGAYNFNPTGNCFPNTDDTYSYFSNYDDTQNNYTFLFEHYPNTTDPVLIHSILRTHDNHTVTAPGCCIFSTCAPTQHCSSAVPPVGAYEQRSGTSVASAFIAGVVALCYSNYWCDPVPYDNTGVILNVVNYAQIYAQPSSTVPTYNGFSAPFNDSTGLYYMGYLPMSLYAV